MGVFLLGCTPQSTEDKLAQGDLTPAEKAQLPPELKEGETALAGKAVNFGNCVDADSTAIFDKNSLTTKSTTTYAGGSKEDKCYTWNKGTPQEKTRLIEGTCKNKKFLYWYATCSDYLGKDFKCVEGKCEKNLPDKYIIAVHSDSPFGKVAEAFAVGKKAELVQFVSLPDLLAKLKTAQPKYLAVVASPEELTPDYMNTLDKTLRNIDDDMFLDVAYGFITSFNEEDAFAYVDRLLQYKTPSEPQVYYPNPYNPIKKKLNNEKIKTVFGCINGDFGFIVDCAKLGEEEHTMDKVLKYSQENNLLWFNVHGAPNELFFSGDDKIVGNLSGALGAVFTLGVECKCKNGESAGTFADTIDYWPEVSAYCLNKTGTTDASCQSTGIPNFSPFVTNASIVIAESCLGTRINGAPSNDNPTYDEILSTGENNLIEGKVNDSIALSFLKSGGYSFLGANVLANSFFMPTDAIMDDMILQGKALGEVVKNYRNKNILSGIFAADQYTQFWVDTQTTAWFLLGDPSMKISNKNIIPENCVKQITKYQTGSKAQFNVTVMFTSDVENSNFNAAATFNSEPDVSSASYCLIRIPKSTLQKIKVTGLVIPGGYQPLTTENSHWDAGDEELILVPNGYGSNKEIKFQAEIE
jgi:hypothetical protein